LGEGSSWSAVETNQGTGLQELDVGKEPLSTVHARALPDPDRDADPETLHDELAPKKLILEN
jgi:hypothetical protein